MNPQQTAVIERHEAVRQLVHSTVKDLTHIGTEISDDKQSVVIGIRFGSQCATIPIKIEDAVKNRLSAKGFVDLIRLPLESILK